MQYTHGKACLPFQYVLRMEIISSHERESPSLARVSTIALAFTNLRLDEVLIKFFLFPTASFDYGEFRTMAELATSSARYDTFGFVFEDAGTYVLSTSCNADSIIVLAVMGEDVRSAPVEDHPMN